MFFMNAVVIVVSIAAAASLILMRNTFRTLEKILYYMVLVVADEHLHSMLPANYKLYEMTRTAAAFAFFKINQLIVLPIVTMWLLYALFNPTLRVIMKLLLTTAWLWSMYGVYLLMNKSDVIRFTGWNWRYSTGMWLGVLVIACLYALWFRRLLRKRDGHAAIA